MAGRCRRGRVVPTKQGERVDRDTIFYGHKELSGAGVTVAVGSGWIGDCTGVMLRGSSGEEHPLSERAG